MTCINGHFSSTTPDSPPQRKGHELSQLNRCHPWLCSLFKANKQARAYITRARAPHLDGGHSYQQKLHLTHMCRCPRHPSLLRRQPQVYSQVAEPCRRLGNVPRPRYKPVLDPRQSDLRIGSPCGEAVSDGGDRVEVDALAAEIQQTRDVLPAISSVSCFSLTVLQSVGDI